MKNALIMLGLLAVAVAAVCAGALVLLHPGSIPDLTAGFTPVAVNVTDTGTMPFLLAAGCVVGAIALCIAIAAVASSRRRRNHELD